MQIANEFLLPKIYLFLYVYIIFFSYFSDPFFQASLWKARENQMQNVKNEISYVYHTGKRMIIIHSWQTILTSLSIQYSFSASANEDCNRKFEKCQQIKKWQIIWGPKEPGIWESEYKHIWNKYDEWSQLRLLRTSMAMLVNYAYSREATTEV